MKNGLTMPGNNNIEFANIIYTGRALTTLVPRTKSIEVFGLDTEAYTSGKCFMIATSEGDVFSPNDFPACFFNRKYRGCNFVAYNLGYDEGALLQSLPKNILQGLREGDRMVFNGFKYHSIPKKCLTISRNKHAVHIWDMYNFYRGSLKYNSKKYLNDDKLESPVNEYTGSYVKSHWEEIGKYCIKDSQLVKGLAELLIKKFEKFGVYPQKLYSTAYVSYQYFRQKTNYVTVKRYWDEYQKVLFYAMQSYNGGKFEVTEKGTGYFYEYDIISAYPYEIANLIDISTSRVVYDHKYHPGAVYGFIKVKMKVPVELYSPLALKYHGVNIYPAGYVEKVVTKNEYDYLVQQGIDLTIKDACWLFCDRKIYPYKREIDKLVKMKQEFKKSGDDLDYHTIKIFLNSLYGKFVQLIKKKGKYHAGSCWNPIYGTVITANVRLRVSQLQQKYKSVIAVHTDSIISKEKLNIPKSGTLGDLIFECEGDGLIIGSGIYQIGKKVKFRGFNLKDDLFPLVDQHKRYISFTQRHAYSWKEVIFRNWENNMINKFEDLTKRVDINFDRKRIWIDDYKYFNDILKRNVISLPCYRTQASGVF